MTLSQKLKREIKRILGQIGIIKPLIKKMNTFVGTTNTQTMVALSTIATLSKIFGEREKCLKIAPKFTMMWALVWMDLSRIC